MKISMTFEGGTDLVKRLNSLPAVLSLKVQRDALAAGAEPIRAMAASLAPTGPDAPHIAENIVIGIPHWTRRNPSPDVSDNDAVVAVGPQKNFFYGFFWEYGWVKHPTAHPFMRPAFDTKAPESLAIIGRVLWEALRKVLPGSIGGSNVHSGGGLQ